MSQCEGDAISIPSLFSRGSNVSAKVYSIIREPRDMIYSVGDHDNENWYSRPRNSVSNVRMTGSPGMRAVVRVSSYPRVEEILKACREI